MAETIDDVGLGRRGVELHGNAIHFRRANYRIAFLDDIAELLAVFQRLIDKGGSLIEGDRRDRAAGSDGGV